MAVVYILGDEIAHDAADEDVRWKMLVPTNSRVVHEGCQTVSHDFHQRPRVLMGDYSRYRPCRRRMFRWKRGSAILKKWPASVALVRPLATQRVFECLDRDQAVHCRLAGQKPRLAPVFVVPDVTQQPHSTRSADERPQTGIRK